MLSLLRAPDAAYGATENSDFRFEENLTNDVKYEYAVGETSAKVVVYPSGSPVKYLKLRFRGDLRGVDKVYGDEWERAGLRAYLEWRSVMPSRSLPWFCYTIEDGVMSCYGVKTGANCFASFQVDGDGITLFLNLCCGNDGTDLRQPLVACEIVQFFGEKGADYYKTAARFSRLMCDKPLLPKEPVFGVNNWYWAYGDISAEVVLKETDQLMRLAKGCTHRPYMIVDDGWQANRETVATDCIGGPWEPNSRFKDMQKIVAEIHAKGAKAGVWFRPLLTRENVPQEAILCEEYGGFVLDPSHPYVIEKVKKDTAKLRSFGFDLIKHDFTTNDATGQHTLSAEEGHVAELCAKNRRFFDRTKTTAQIFKNLYAAIQRSADGADVIGCNTIGHLTAGIHSLYRIGNDTSGRAFEWTRRDGVNSLMRLPLNGSFYRADPDCAPFTNMVKFKANLSYLEMCAKTGMATIASVTPDVLSVEQAEQINRVFLIADAGGEKYGIKNYEKTSCPETFVSASGKDEIRYDWNEVYDGSRTVLDWYH